MKSTVLFFFFLVSIAIASLIVTVDAMPAAKQHQKHHAPLVKRALEFPDFEDFANVDGGPQTEDSSEEDEDLYSDEAEGEGLIFMDSGSTREHATRRKRQMSASDDYFDFFPPPPPLEDAQQSPHSDSEEEQPKPTTEVMPAEEIEEAISISSLMGLGKTSTLETAKHVVDRSGALRNALVTSLRQVIETKNEQSGISADSAITTLKIQALAKATQVVTNGVLNFTASLPQIMTLTIPATHRTQYELALLWNTFDILKKTLSQVRLEVGPVIDERVEEDRSLVQILDEMQLLMTEITSEFERARPYLRYGMDSVDELVE